MSDPVKNAEVEDVLSSIRRLVSEDKRPLQRPKSIPEPVRDRLVLTPALRVEDDVSSTSEVAQDFFPRSEIDAFLFDQKAESESDAPKHKSQALEENYADDPYDFDEIDNVDDDEAESNGETAGFDEVVDESQEQPDLMEKSAALTAKIAALETAIGSISDDWEPDGTGIDANDGTEPSAMAWEDDTSASDGLAELDVADSDVAESDVAESGVAEIGVAESDGAESDGAENDDAESDGDDFGAIAFSHRTEAIRGALGQAEELDDKNIVGTQPDEQSEDEQPEVEKPNDALGTETTPETANTFDFAAEDQVLDEETLRELVREIVQSELQGALGERITRNVRRLVRREIHRALTAHEID